MAFDGAWVRCVGGSSTVCLPDVHLGTAAAPSPYRRLMGGIPDLALFVHHECAEEAE